MSIETNKLAKAIAAIWVFLSIPISQHLYNEVLDDGLFMRIFALAAVAAPVWLVFGWRWLSNNAPMPPRMWGTILIAGIAACIFLANDYYKDEIAYIPAIMASSFVILLWVYDKQEIRALLGKIFSPPTP